VKTAACAKAETDEMLPHEHMDESEVANTDENSAECDEELHVSTWNLGLFKPVDDVEAQETFESLDCTVAPDEAGEIDPIVVCVVWRQQQAMDMYCTAFVALTHLET
jgi:hypothetical protein